MSNRISVKRSLGFCLLLSAVFIVAGCDKKVDLGGAVDVTGTILGDGEPLAGAIVTFFNSSPKPGTPATARNYQAKTDSAGKFKLTDVYFGSYTVNVDANPPGEDAEAGASTGPYIKYVDGGDLKAAVSAEKTEFEFDLKKSE